MNNGRKTTAYRNRQGKQFSVRHLCLSVLGASAAFMLFSFYPMEKGALKADGYIQTVGDEGSGTLRFDAKVFEQKSVKPMAHLQSLLSLFESRSAAKQDPFFPLQWALPSWPNTQLDRFPMTMEQDNPLLRASKNDEFFSWSSDLGSENLQQPNNSKSHIPMACPAHWPLTLGFAKLSDKLLPLYTLGQPDQYSQLGSFLTVLDGPVDYAHPELRHLLKSPWLKKRDGMIHQPDEVKTRQLDYVHGTHVAGFLSAQRDGLGITGLLPGIALQLKSFELEDDHKSILLNSFLDAMKDIVSDLKLSSPEPRVILVNAAFGSNDPEQIQVLRDELLPLLNEILDHKVVLVVPAGNGLSETELATPSFPSAFAGEISSRAGLMLSVGASDFCSSAAWFSKLPPPVFASKIYAPGERIYATLPMGDYGFLSGTSLAAAQVAAVLTVGAASAPQLSPHELVKLMVRTAKSSQGLGVGGVIPDLTAFWEELMIGDE